MAPDLKISGLARALNGVTFSFGGLRPTFQMASAAAAAAMLLWEITQSASAENSRAESRLSITRLFGNYCFLKNCIALVRTIFRQRRKTNWVWNDWIRDRRSSSRRSVWQSSCFLFSFARQRPRNGIVLALPRIDAPVGGSVLGVLE